MFLLADFEEEHIEFLGKDLAFWKNELETLRGKKDPESIKHFEGIMKALMEIYIYEMKMSHQKGKFSIVMICIDGCIILQTFLSIYMYFYVSFIV